MIAGRLIVFGLLAATLAEARPVQILRDSSGNPLATGVATASARHGLLEVRDGQLLYTPAPGFTGTDRVSITPGPGESPRAVTVDVRSHPNFLFILTDDQSWTSLSTRMDGSLPASASDYHRTPHIDRLAADGMRFSRGYSPAANCSPTRYANLTGKTCARLHFTDIVGRGHTKKSIGQRLIPIDKATKAIRHEDTTLPELLRTLPGADYATAHFGKWHLGGGGPEEHGFDQSDGATGNREGNKGPEAIDDPKLAFHIAGRGKDFLGEVATSGRPFYCQLSHYAVHAKIQYRPETLAATNGWKRGTNHHGAEYAAMLADLDASIGEVLDELDELGLRHSTYVVFQADNGAPQFLSNAYPLKRYKPEIWEGGTRVPTLVRGPGIATNSQCDHAMMGIDLLPTLWELAGGEAAALPDDIDGASVVPWLRGHLDTPVARPGQLVIHSPHYILTKDGAKNQRPSCVLHDGPWKLVAWFETGDVLLYNLEEEMAETTDLSTRHPDEKLRLWKQLRDYLHGVEAQLPRLDASHPDNPGADGDADGDGLPDAWEISRLLTFALGPDDDPDGDGISNAAEHTAGSDPLS